MRTQPTPRERIASRAAAASRLLLHLVTVIHHLPSCSRHTNQRAYLARQHPRATPRPNNDHAALKDDSALLRHEVAYCLGQRQDPKAVEILKRTLADGDEHPM